MAPSAAGHSDGAGKAFYEIGRMVGVWTPIYLPTQIEGLCSAVAAGSPGARSIAYGLWLLRLQPFKDVFNAWI
jgi:hypothetical protein